MKRAFLLAALSSVLLLQACSGDKVIFEEFQEISEQGWWYEDMYEFDFDVTDTTDVYRLLVFFEYDTDYRWENFYARIHTTFPGDTARQDIISFQLADATGTWFGECGKYTCKLNIPLQEKVRFPQTGNYQIAFEQYMRQEIGDGHIEYRLKVSQAQTIISDY